MPHVFISYVREDQEVVDRIAQELESAGIDVWLDRKRIKPGIEWEAAIERAIRDGACFIACFTRAFAERETTEMYQELYIATERLRLHPEDSAWFLPVVFNGGKVPDQRIGKDRGLRSFQEVNLSGDWRGGIDTLVSAILDRTLGDDPAPLPDRRERALRWKRIERLADRLIDPTASVEDRQYAARTLESMASEAAHAAGTLQLALADVDKSVRVSAIRALTSMGETTAGVLVEAIRSPFPEIRDASLLGLQALGPRVAHHVDRLVEALEHVPESTAPLAASDVLASIGEAAVERLVAEMAVRNPKTLPGAARALEKMGSRASACASTMTRWLRDPDKALRAAATGVIAGLIISCPERDWKDAVVPLAEAIREPDRSGRAYGGLRALGPSASSAIPILIAILREHNDDPTSFSSNHDLARKALFNIGPDAVPALADLLSDRQPIEDVEADWLRLKARYNGLWALGWIQAKYQDERALALIRHVALDPEEHLWLSAHAAGYLSHDAKTPEYLAVLKEAAWPSATRWDEVSKNAIEALARFENEAASVSELVIEILESDASAYVKEAAAETLGKIGSSSARAVSALRALSDWKESASARKTLERWGVSLKREE